MLMFVSVLENDYFDAENEYCHHAFRAFVGSYLSESRRHAMQKNVGNVDRAIRILGGIALLSLFFLAAAPLKWIGLIGIAPILTGLLGWCPAYPMFGINTCGEDASQKQ
jgi:hypothetical protein